ncbi:helix-turn-helix transcriptional regulator [Streptomyces longwoodensis]|uniref:helix-turn-helix transcriptional regulator n=1 Tax=Streptomyces longwoodensis TaxID=68231 RepID=UPI0033DB3594
MLIARELELTALRIAVRDSAAGRARTIFVEGPVGCGKTELLEALAALSSDAGAIVLRATGMPSEESVPLGLVRQLVHSEALPADTRNWLERVLDEEEGTTGPGLPDATAHGRGAGMQRFWAALRTVARDRLVVIGIDDLQHADSASLQYLLHIAGRSRTSRLLMVFTEALYYRQQDTAYRTEFLRQPNFRRIRLECLGPDAVARFLAHHQPRLSVGEDTAEEFYAVTRGNPLLLRALQEERGTTAGTSSGDCLDPGPGETFAHAVLTCLDRSGPTAAKVAEGLAVLGATATLDLLSRLCRLPRTTAAQGLRALHAAGVVDECHFQHPAVCSQVLDGMDPEHRQQLHRRAATLLYADGARASAVAPHLLALERISEPWAAAVLCDAAEEALADDEDGVAVACLELAHRVCEDPGRRIEIKVRTSVVLRRNHPSAAEAAAEELLAAVRAGQAPPRYTTAIADLFLAHRRLEEAYEVLVRGPQAAAVAPAPAGPVRTAGAGAGAGAAVPAGPSAAAPDRGTAAPDRATGGALMTSIVERRYPWADGRLAAVPQQGGELRALPARPGGEALASRGGQPWRLLLGPRRGDFATAAEEMLQRSALTDATMEPLTSAIKCLLFSGKTKRARYWCDVLLQNTARRGAGGWYAMIAGLRAEVALAQGNPEEAERCIDAGLDRLTERKRSVLACGLIAVQVMAQTAMGKYEAGARKLNEPVPQAVYASAYGMTYMRARGHYHLATNRLDAALDDFMAVGRTAQRWGLDQPVWVPWRSDLAEALLGTGECKEAERLLLEQISRLDDANPRIHGISLRLLAEASAPGERLGLLTRAVAQLRLSGDRLELARALCDLGETHKRLGDLAQAAMASRRAWELARECGAEPLCARIRLEHGEAGWGTGPEKTLVDTREAKLSDSEKRVAALAACGYTNRDISSQLYITVSTVEQHLTRVYRKLKIGGRQQLPIDLQFDLPETA